jgi:hypothetical protein
MYPISRLSAALAAAGLLLCSSPALADGRASVTISNMQFGALDLTPDDGVAAGYSIASVEASQLLTNIVNPQVNTLAHNLYPPPYQPGTARVDYGATFAEASTGGWLGDISTTAYATPGVTEFGAATVNSSANQNVWLTLQPHTVLTLSGNLHTLAENSMDEARYPAAASALIGFQNAEGEAGISSLSITGPDPGTDEWHKDFTLAFANGSDENVTVELYIYSWSSLSAIPLIPEPGTWSMLGAGMLLLGAAGRYRRR